MSVGLYAFLPLSAFAALATWYSEMLVSLLRASAVADVALLSHLSWSSLAPRLVVPYRHVIFSDEARHNRHTRNFSKKYPYTLHVLHIHATHAIQAVQSDEGQVAHR